MSVSGIPMRTSYPKHTSYHGDGNGRDTYIITGYGGLIKDGAKGASIMSSPFTGYQTQKHTTALYINQGNQLRRSGVSKESTSLLYYGDG